MKPTSSGRATRQQRLTRIGGAVALMAAAVLVVELFRTPATGSVRRGTIIEPPSAGIPAEVDVFRTRPADLAVDPMSTPAPGARLRTLASYRALRAYPGAPPQVPHSLTPDEFRQVSCNSCHMRGGWSERFGAYTPVTPHPELRSCLQCHGVDDGVVGVLQPGHEGDRPAAARTPRAAASDFVPSDWRTTEWPLTGQRAMPGSPPAIPHTLAMRGNCLSCHGGPSAVAEIRTTHPQQSNCRQCHGLAAQNEELFTRPARDTGSSGGGVR